ncbi:MAG TPA: GNAT family N-acetyltransferase [Solirubrobacteraceae bacterium]|nr:GNAT family N-acetyltransferase [Solirubrobacteraceae bacterium]
MLTKLSRYLREHGARETAVAVARRFWHAVYTQESLIVIVRKLDSIVEPWRDEGLRLEDLGSQHLPALAELNRKRAQPDADRRFASYVRQGFHGFVGYREDELVGYYWWVDRDVPTLFPDLRKLGLGIELGAGDVYGSDFYVLDEHRGGGLAADFLFKVESGLRDRGFERLWGYVVSTNRPARWIYSTRGYVPMWTVRRTKVLAVWRTTRESS